MLMYNNSTYRLKSIKSLFIKVIDSRFTSNMSKMRVLVTNADVPDSAITLLKESNLDVIVNEEYTREAVLKQIVGVHAAFWATNKIKVDAEMLTAAGNNLKIVASLSVGLDHIDIDLLNKLKIKLTNTSKISHVAVADMAVLLALAASRRLHEGRLHIENGTWYWNTLWMLGQDINQSTVGIVGLGGIGQCIAKKLQAFDVNRILYTGHKEKEEGKRLRAEFVSLDELLRQSDFVIASCPLTQETHEMFNESAFNKMKKTSVFVNVSRGADIHQPALIKALKEGTIFAAGLDVMTPEPLPKDDKLLKLPNCVLTPHLGSATLGTRTAMAELTSRNIIAALRGEPLLSPAL